MRSVIAVLACILATAAFAADDGATGAEVDVAIERGLGFLSEDARAWNAEHHCASCHHAGLVIFSMHEAKRLGRVVDEPMLVELTKLIAESGDGKFGLARPSSAPKAASPKAIYFALALGMDPNPDLATQKGLQALIATIEVEQTENGSWSAWPGTRPPIFGESDESLTALATLAVLPVAVAGDSEAMAARDAAVEWLSATKSDDDPQSVALRLIIWKRLGHPDSECEPLIQRIVNSQNSDGGWSQTTEMASDAWATGQALYALAHTGIKFDSIVISRGRTFLVKSQRPSGSWSMTSRPTSPGGKGSTSLIPITGAGSAWAVLGLIRTTDKAQTRIVQ